MRTHHQSRTWLSVAGVLCMICLAATRSIAGAGVTNVSSRTTTNGVVAVTNQTPASVFAIPHSFAEGRDPFFPNSTYPIRNAQTNPGPNPRPAPSLVLKGLSGTPERPLAIINGATFAEGDENELPVPGGGRVTVRVLDIKPDEQSVLVEVNGEKQELRLKTRF